MNERVPICRPLIPVVPSDVSEVDDLAFGGVELERLPEHLELPLRWAAYFPLSVVLTITMDRLLSVEPQEIDGAVAGVLKSELPVLDLPSSLWCRTLRHAFERLQGSEFPSTSAALRSRLWTMKVFVDRAGRDWSADVFERAVRIADGSLS